MFGKLAYRNNRLQRGNRMNPFRDLPYPPKGLKPVKQVLLQEPMHFVVVLKLTAALLNMLDPVETSILNFWRQVLLHSTALYVSSKPSWRFYATNILFEICRHKPNTAVRQSLMRLLFVDPEV